MLYGFKSTCMECCCIPDVLISNILYNLRDLYCIQQNALLCYLFYYDDFVFIAKV